MTPDRREIIERLVARLRTSSQVAHIALCHAGQWADCPKKRCTQDRAAITEALR